MRNKRAYIGAIFVALVLIGFCAIWHDGYRVGVRDTEQEPTPMMIRTIVIALNDSMYNQTWYDIGRGYLDESEESLRSPTLHNDSFLIMVSVYYDASYTFGVQVFGAPRPHANITVEVLPFGYNWHNYTIERVVIGGYNMTESRKIINLYNNTAGRMVATDWMSLAFFGYGSYSSEIVFWNLQSIIFTVGPVWYEEVG